MNNTLKDLFAGLAIIIALVVGLPMMLQGETHVDLSGVQNMQQIYEKSLVDLQRMPAIVSMIQHGLKPYFIGMGLIFLLVAVAYMLIDGENKIATLKNTDSESS